ncbi:hypothetical protein TNCV_3741981 [Trichonephila clavipes]|nr:hypothetical protein TNCV_3741981 [Trichonephila clavipes]
MQYRKAPNVTTTLSPAMLFLKRNIRTRIDLLLPELKTKIQDSEMKFFGDQWLGFTEQLILDGSLVINQDGILHYIIDVVRRHGVDQSPVGDKGFHLCTRDFHHQRFEKNGAHVNAKRRGR